MAAFNSAPYKGEIGLSEADLTTIREKDGGIYGVGLDAFVRQGRYFTIPLDVHTTANNNTKDSGIYVARFRFLVWGAEFVAETAGGSTGTMDLEKALAAAPTTFATMLEADVDVKTAVGIFQAGSITNGKETIEIGDRLKAQSISGSAADQTGARCILHCIRL